MHNPGRIWFVTGTGTGVGKTVLAAGLLRAARDAGLHAQAVKAVQTGCAATGDGGWLAPDLEVYREACPEAPCRALDCFAEPCSPHLAAALEGRRLSAADLAERLAAVAGEAELTIVEGAGGVMVPLNDGETMLDLMAHLDAEIVLAVGNALGAVNHALLSVDALRGRGLRLAATAMLEPSPPDSADGERRIREDNPAIIAALARIDPPLALPHLPGLRGSAAARREAWDALAEALAPLVARLDEDGGPARADADTERFDREHLWHPYAATHPPAQAWTAASTSGNRIRLADGRTLVDGMSSWWAAIHGYNHPELTAALRRQAARMPHVMFGGLTHEPAAEAARRLLAVAPSPLRRVFYVDSGSVAVEAALKMALQYQQARGQSARTRFASPLGGYHGDTLGAMGVCDPVNGMHRLFDGVLAKHLHFERPACRFDGAFDPAATADMERVFAEHGHEIAAAVIEPIAQGAGGMWFYHPGHLRRLRELCDRHGALLIFDEIASGFGRTGKMFAGEWADVCPDIMCVGKALTGGMMTLAAVLARDEVAATVSSRGVFMHGPTFMANPLACAVAAKSLEVLAASPWREHVAALEQALERGLAPCRAMAGVADVRVLGGIGVVEMAEPVAADRLRRFFVDAGVWIRPFAKLIYLIPPYATPAADLELLTGTVRRAVETGQWK